MRMRKAQMEILGLAIVVLLLILGMVFVVKFVAMTDKGSVRKEVADSQIASNYIATYLDTTVPECSKLTIKELLMDCAENNPGPAGGTIDCDGGTKSCEMAEGIATTVFSKTFDQQKKPYYFSVKIQNGNPFIELSHPSPPITKCLGTKRSKDYILSTNSGVLHVTLDLCGSK